MNTQRVRIDKWLWAARFYKTRSLAAQAVEGSKIELNGQRPKPSKDVKINDALKIRIGPYVYEVTVSALAERRGPAAEAVKLYQESAASRAAREELATRLRASAAANPFLRGRPTKKVRRDLDKMLTLEDDHSAH